MASTRDDHGVPADEKTPRKAVFAGLGGLYAHGRWTWRGKPVIYTSQSNSLAVLEYTLNYRRHGWIPATVLGRVRLPDSILVENVNVADLPVDWAAADPPDELKAIGASWLERAHSAVLKVPSAVVTEEFNFLINPQHLDFVSLALEEPAEFRFDRRLLRSRKR